jgi:hypothetical protein
MLATADADLRSLSYGHLVGDFTGPAQRGKHASAVGRRLAVGCRAPECALSAQGGPLIACGEMLVGERKQERVRTPPASP